MEYDSGHGPFIRLFGRRSFRLFLGQHSLRALQRSLRPRLPACRIDKGMRIARFAGRQQLSPLKKAAAGIALGWLPRMGHEVPLPSLNGVELLGVDPALLRTLEARRARSTAAPDPLVGPDAVLEQQALDEQVAGSMTRRGVDDQVLIAEVEMIAFMHFHVALRGNGGLAAIPIVWPAVERFDHTPVFGRRHHARAGEFLQPRRAAGMVDMSMIDDDVFDVDQIDADLLDVVHNIVDERLLSGVEHDVTLRRSQNPRGHVAGTDMLEIVEHFEGFDLLNLDLTLARTFAAGLADRLIHRLGLHTILAPHHRHDLS